MAIDTAQKRRSIMRFGKVGVAINPIPDADGSFDAGDRFHFLWLYSGLVGGVAPATGEGDYIIIFGRRRGRR